MIPDLTAAVQAVASRRLSPLEALDASLAAADAPACRHAFVRRFDAPARAQAAAVQALTDAGNPLPPLAGLAVSVKDLFDVAGAPTTGGSRVLAEAPAAQRDATAVARLRAAGAALVGHTNLTEFAFSGVGINPHHGTPANPVTLAIDPRPRIPGGSTSGGAVSVATGAAWAALGSDTGGSLRIPAALQGLVGFKGTQRVVPLDGCIPLSTTLDTAGAITRSVRDAVLLHELLAQRPVALAGRAVRGLRLGVPQGDLLDGLDDGVAAAFQRALTALSRAGARLVDCDLPAPGALAQGGFSAAESWAWHRERLGRDGARYDPRVAARIRRGETLSAADYIDLHRLRDSWIASMQRVLAPLDLMLSPTCPVVAPLLAPLVEDDDAFFRTNALLLRNPSLVNLLDGCALSLPCHRPGELPAGLMLWRGAMDDDVVLDVALAVEALLMQEAA